MNTRHRNPAFTLIELLIVVAIIGILAAIAIPNFSNARLRAEIARIESNMKTLMTANEMYRLDRNTYLTGYAYGGGGWNDYRSYNDLTTPVAYLSSLQLVEDPFARKDKKAVGGNAFDQKFEYTPRKQGRSNSFPNPMVDMYLVESVGPDGEDDYGSPSYPNIPIERYYSSSNGLKSEGDIFRLGGQLA